ncbi:nicotinate phosphoribosyltransferase [Aureispira anguillae]|uniref:Nicotinate phosphoribosyltransferase n=1 Tax=Aureispira anguillae TaxID=2864201 RepID=A0A915YDG3_9BACT|nr:nicotinate phosphoribosyltransferase [Aureispira anguillae]BDS11075.1 nicotinate phosphoribosyltransferase [Aureispira anguillae]
MNHLKTRYQTNLALLTDLYQLTMAYGYWKSNRIEDEAIFHLFYRKNPFQGDYAIACGLQDVIDFLSTFQFSPSDIAYLRSLKDSNDDLLFEEDFLVYLAEMKFSCTVDAIEEGTVVFPQEPILRIKGPLIQAQLLETILLNCINFQTLIATKAARIVQAAENDTVLEFGLRRAQGIDGSLSASRAAYIGGCHATSNVLAGKIYGIPVKGTHGHSWVMSFDDEIEAFEAYAKAMPNNCIFLVDTYDTIKGVKKAIRVGKKLRKKGHSFLGIRLDSGDLSALSIQARQLLDKAGFEDAIILASDSLDEYQLKTLKNKDAQITAWGVGTNLVTAKDQPALGAVYKLAAIKKKNAPWQYKIKLSNTPNKVSTPGLLQVRRYLLSDGQPFGDMIWNTEDKEPIPRIQSFDGRAIVTNNRAYKELLVPIFQAGELVYQAPNIHQIRKRGKEEIDLFKKVDFKLYPIGLEEQLNALKLALIQQHI